MATILFIFQTLYFSMNSLFLCLTIIFYILAMIVVLQRYKRTYPRIGATSQNVSSSSNNGREQMNRIKRRRIVRSMKLVSIIVVDLLVLSGPMTFLGIIFSNGESFALILALRPMLLSILLFTARRLKS